MSQPFFGTGTTEATFQQLGKSPLDMHLRNSLVRTGASSGAHFFKTITGMPSGPLDLELSRFLMSLLTCFTVTEEVERFVLVRLGKTGRERPPSSRDEFRDGTGQYFSTRTRPV